MAPALCGSLMVRQARIVWNYRVGLNSIGRSYHRSRLIDGSLRLDAAGSNPPAIEWTSSCWGGRQSSRHPYSSQFARNPISCGRGSAE